MRNLPNTENYESPSCKLISLIIESGILNNSIGASVETPGGETDVELL